MYKRVLIPENWGKPQVIIYPSEESKGQREVVIRLVPDDFGGDKLALVCDPRYPDMDGDFMFFRSDKRVWIHVGHGLFALYRSICYMLDTHAHEYPLLEEVRRVCGELEVECEECFPRGVNWFKGTVLSQVELLGKPRNPEKCRAQQQFRLLVTTQERKQVIVVCRNTAALESLIQRLSQIRSMKPWLQYYRQLVMEMILLLEDQLNRARELLLVIERACTDERIAEVRQSILELQSVVPLLVLKPYNHLTKRLRDEVQLIADASKREDWKTLKRTVRIALNATRLMCLRRDLELAKLHVNRRVKDHFVDDRLIHSIQSMLSKVLNEKLPRIDETGWEKPVKTDLEARLRDAYSGVILRDFPRALAAIDSALILI